MRKQSMIGGGEFEFEPVDLDSMSEEDLNNYIDYLDRLWEK
ncbi:hypothetical protein QTG90_11105 [Clostridium perfringens]|nr:hypothetical protein [Clostridium perfringens]